VTAHRRLLEREFGETVAPVPVPERQMKQLDEVRGDQDKDGWGGVRCRRRVQKKRVDDESFGWPPRPDHALIGGGSDEQAAKTQNVNCKVSQ
jgi:hypothetical protein